MGLVIDGIGTALPEMRIAQTEAAQAAAVLTCETIEEAQLLKYLYSRTGVQTRHSVLLETTSNGHPAAQSFYRSVRSTRSGPTTNERMERYEAEAAPLALAACLRALDDGQTDPDQITHLITVSCSGFSAPGVDLALVRELPLPTGVARTHIGFMGCHAAINGLRVAQAFASDASARVLLCAVELCSLHHQYRARPDQVIANALFADGAAAVVGHGDASAAEQQWQVVATGSAIVETADELMSWRIGDNGFRMTLSAEVPQLIHEHLPAWIDGWLAAQGLAVADVATWAVHPGGPAIIQSVGEVLGLRPDQLETSHKVLAAHGNMSSPTVLFILKRLRADAAPRPCVMLAFGPGLTIEAALVR